MDGIVIINKEKGITSRDVVNKACKKLGTRHIGHTGTLDPIATGVIVLGVNDGCKIIDLLTSDSKIYEAEVVVGYSTDSLDVTGNITNKCQVNSLTDDLVNSVLNSFIGKYMQEVPKYSAVHVDGKRLYEYARCDIDVVLPKREVEIYSISLIDHVYFDEYYRFKFRVHVSKGTYIRSLIRDIGDRLGYLCSMSELKRIKQGNFLIEDAKLVDDITSEDIISIKDALSYLPSITVSDSNLKKVKNGGILDISLNDKTLILDSDGLLLAIYEPYSDNSKCKPYKVFWRN